MISRRHKAGWANPAAGVSGMPYLPRMGGSSSGQGAADRQDRRAALRRRVLVWVCRRIAALLAVGCALGFTASRAVAGQVPIVFRYSCKLPIVGGTSLTATFVWPNGLQSATVGTRTPSLPVKVAATVGSAARTVVSFGRIKWIEGTADVSAEIMAPQGDIREHATLTVPRTDVSTGLWPADRACVRPHSLGPAQPDWTGQGRGRNRGHPPRHSDRDRDPERPGEHQRLVHPGSRPDWRRDVGADPSRRRFSGAACSATQAAPRPTPTLTPTPTQTPTATQTPTPPRASSPSPSSQSVSAMLLRLSAPFARSFPGFVLLALFLLCAAVLPTLKPGLENLQHRLSDLWS